MRLILILIIIYLVMQNPTMKKKVMDFIGDAGKAISAQTNNSGASFKDAINLAEEKNE